MEPLPALRPLLMEAKPLADLMADQSKWISLAERLKSAFPAQPKTSKNANEVIHLCRVYYSHKKKRYIFSYAYHYTTRVTEVDFDKLATDTADFLEEFMRVRGQLGYFQGQDWYTNREYVIAIDVNYYPDRSSAMYTMSPMFHKDTGGNNLFVNLIFDNKQPIEATEWFVDVQEPTGKRAEWQASLLPPAHLKELAALRQELRDSKQHETPIVHGGVIKGDNVYVSWVDDLVWHATPSLNKRITYTSAAAVAAHTLIRASLKGGASFQKDGVRIHPVELLATMAEEPKTELAQWLKTQSIAIQDIDFEVAKAAWFELYDDDPGKARLAADALLREATDWRMLGQVAESNATDTRLDEPGAKAPNVKETPVGLSTVRRANSLDKGELKATAEANKGIPRSFVRTWIRVIPVTSKELAAVKFIPE